MDDHQLRLAALQEAVKATDYHDLNDQQMVARARAFYEFLVEEPKSA